MNSFQKILAVGLVAAVGLAVVAGLWIDRKVDAVTNVTQQIVDRVSAGDRVLDLPDDGKDYFLSLLLHDNWKRWPKDRRIVTMFDTNPALISLKNQCYYQIYTPKDEAFQRLFAGRVNNLPCILLQTKKGGVATKISGENLPDDDATLVTMFEQSGAARLRPHPFRPWLNHPTPSPDCRPRPKPKPDPKPDVTPIPDTVTPPITPPFPWGLFALVLGLTTAVAFVFQFRNRVLG